MTILTKSAKFRLSVSTVFKLPNKTLCRNRTHFEVPILQEAACTLITEVSFGALIFLSGIFSILKSIEEKNAILAFHYISLGVA